MIEQIKACEKMIEIEENYRQTKITKESRVEIARRLKEVAYETLRVTLEEVGERLDREEIEKIVKDIEMAAQTYKIVCNQYREFSYIKEEQPRFEEAWIIS